MNIFDPSSEESSMDSDTDFKSEESAVIANMEISDMNIINFGLKINHEFFDVSFIAHILKDFRCHYLCDIEEDEAEVEKLSCFNNLKRLDHYKQMILKYFEEASVQVDLEYESNFRSESLDYLLRDEKIYYQISSSYQFFSVKNTEIAKIQAIFILYAVIIDYEKVGQKEACVDWLLDSFFHDRFWDVLNLTATCISLQLNILDSTRDLAEIAVDRLDQLRKIIAPPVIGPTQSPVALTMYGIPLQTPELVRIPLPIETISTHPRLKIPVTGFNEAVLLKLSVLTNQGVLPPLRGKLEPEENPSVYFQQFQPYILEEISAGVQTEIETIQNKELLPFQVDMNEIQKRHRDTVHLIHLKGTALEKALPVLDHGFFNEVVMIIYEEIKQRNSRKQGDRSYILAIANVDRHTEDSEEPDNADKAKRRVGFNTCLRRSDHGCLKGKKVVQVHWLYGLIPDERMYEICRAKPVVPWQHQFMRAELPEWPTVDSTQVPVVTTLNPLQTEIVLRLSRAEEGLYFLQGPPGTGKTTTVAALVMQILKQQPTKRLLICAPSNQALRNLLLSIAELSPAAHMALVGVGKDLPESLQDVFVHGYCTRLFEPLILLKRELNDQTLRIERADEIINELIDRLEEICQKFSHFCDDKIDVLLTSNFHLKKIAKTAVELAVILQCVVNYRAVKSEEDIQGVVDQTEECIKLLQDCSSTIEEFLVKRAQIVFATLVSSGRPWLNKQVATFDIVILDEAAQALVPASLIPLKFSPSVYIQVGDPKQLPATVKSKTAKAKRFDDSMMHWLTVTHEQGYKMLKTQYRMHPEICQWISTQFYNDDLVSDESVSNRPCILKDNKVLHGEFQSPSLFFNIASGRENRLTSASILNEKEAQAVVDMAYYLLSVCGFRPEDIGIITFYARQVSLIKQLLSDNISCWIRDKKEQKQILKQILVHTVDGFQGGERKITLVSMVRTKNSVGFLSDSRRLNVGMSRAQYARWTFGHFTALENCSNSDDVREFSSCHYNSLIAEEKFKLIVSEGKKKPEVKSAKTLTKRS
jgi:superfamily I DNA and/or RNA helicase